MISISISKKYPAAPWKMLFIPFLISKKLDSASLITTSHPITISEYFRWKSMLIGRISPRNPIMIVQITRDTNLFKKHTIFEKSW